jgi:hypothetical protein
MHEVTVADGTGMVAGGVRNLLRIEGLLLFSTMLVAYETVGGSWSLFALLFLLPDISFAAYSAGPRIGGMVYNAAHSTIGPIMFAAFGHAHDLPMMRAIGIIWLAHVGLDRALGYGLKYPTGFAFTHLGHIGWNST